MDELQVPLQFQFIQLQVCLHHPRHQLQIFTETSHFSLLVKGPGFNPLHLSTISYFWETLKYNDTNTNFNFEIISSLVKQCVPATFTDFSRECLNCKLETGQPHFPDCRNISVCEPPAIAENTKNTSTPMPNLHYSLQHDITEILSRVKHH